MFLFFIIISIKGITILAQQSLENDSLETTAVGPTFNFDIPVSQYGTPKGVFGSRIAHSGSDEFNFGSGSFGLGLAENGLSDGTFDGSNLVDFDSDEGFISPTKPRFKLPKLHHGPPKPHYGPPKSHYGPPKPHYGPPKPHYGPPKPHYGPPKSHYGPPKPHYGPPKLRYGIPKVPSKLQFGHTLSNHKHPILGFLPPKLGLGQAGFFGDFSDEHLIGAPKFPVYHKPKCQPKYITKYKTKEIPIYKTLVSKALIPTPVYKTHYSTYYVTKYSTNYVPKYITKTDYIPHVQYVTDYETKYLTEYKTKYIQKPVYIPKYVTKKEYSTKYIKDYVPTYVTVTKDHVSYKTVCPKKGY